MLGGSCSYISECTRLLLDSRTAKFVDQTKMGSMSGVLSVLMTKNKPGFALI